MTKRHDIHRDLFGSLLGIAVFLGGVALLYSTFKLAYEMFVKSPSETLGVQSAQTLNLAMAGQNLVGTLLKILLLILMAAVSSVIANRGITLYVKSVVRHEAVKSEG